MGGWRVQKGSQLVAASGYFAMATAWTEDRRTERLGLFVSACAY